MNRQQKTAIENHCRLSCETVNPLFFSRRNGYTVIVTVNSGYE